MSCAISDSPSPSMFIAPRDAKCSSPRCSFAGHDVFSQRQTASPSSRTQLTAAARAGRRHHPRLAVRRPPAEHRPDDSRDDIAGLLDDDPVAFADVLAREVVGVVQRRHRDRRAGQEHRFEHRERRDRAGAPDVDLDLSQQRRLLFRRKLERDGPARKLAGGAERAALRVGIDLDDHAVGIEGQRAAAARPIRRRRRPARQRRCSAASAVRRAVPIRAAA